MKIFGAGDLDRIIALQHGTPANDPATNEPIKTYATYATVWAQMEFHRSNEGETVAREYAEYGLFFTIRWRAGVLADDRIVHESQSYEIVGRPREIGRRQGLKIQARLVE